MANSITHYSLRAARLYRRTVARMARDLSRIAASLNAVDSRRLIATNCTRMRFTRAEEASPSAKGGAGGRAGRCRSAIRRSLQLLMNRGSARGIINRELLIRSRLLRYFNARRCPGNAERPDPACSSDLWRRDLNKLRRNVRARRSFQPLQELVAAQRRRRSGSLVVYPSSGSAEALRAGS